MMGGSYGHARNEMVFDCAFMPSDLGGGPSWGRRNHTGTAMQRRWRERVIIIAAQNEARGNARSFPGAHPPGGAKEIGREKIRTVEYIYYKDKLGNYWYTTDSTLKIEKEMTEAQNRRRWRRRR